MPFSFYLLSKENNALRPHEKTSVPANPAIIAMARLAFVFVTIAAASLLAMSPPDGLGPPAPPPPVVPADPPVGAAALDVGGDGMMG